MTADPAARFHEAGDMPWWHGAAIYQVYPRSFQDTDGDGIGDLPGIIRRLDHIAALGVDAVWLSPFFASPMRDFGYDVSDWCAVDPMFGTLADFDVLIERAHALGLRVIIDQVYAHSSDQHAWFAQSRADRTNPRADWYVWADAKVDGTPPSNWQSVFGGPAWTWDARRGQYYMHTFLKEQPQLHVHNRAVQDALLDVARFWLERGVDGFRLDALNHAMHDPALRDNPPITPGSGRTMTRPYDFQIKRYSQSHPDMVGFVERLAATCREYGAIHTLAEIGGDEAEAERRAYTAGPDRLDSAYGFDFLYAPELTAAFVSETLAGWTDEATWPTWAFENHDAPRGVSRWLPQGCERAAFLRLKAALLLALRGNVILYQGEELGLEQDTIAFDRLRDPEAIANWPLTLGRDGARTPIPWSDEPGGGFSEGEPWLPLGEDNRRRAVVVQEGDPASHLNFTRALLALRADEPALRHGTLGDLAVNGDVLGFTRRFRTRTVRCWFNLGSEAASPEGIDEGRALLSINDASHDALPAWSALYLDLSD